MIGASSYVTADCANPGCRRGVTLAGRFCCGPCERVSPAEPGSLAEGDHPLISHTRECDELAAIASGGT